MNFLHEVHNHAKAKQKFAKAYHFSEKKNKIKVPAEIVYKDKSCSTFENVSSTFGISSARIISLECSFRNFIART